MSENLYRKGPWRAETRYVRAADDCYIAKTYACSDRDYNTQLMATAPELLEALQFVLRCKDYELAEAFIKAKAAIDKATTLEVK